MRFDTIIVGGGLSGLSAALHLSRSGQRVALIERKRFLGGRAATYDDHTFGLPVDNGQHLMMGCYEATIEYLRLTGALEKVSLQPTQDVMFVTGKGKKHRLYCPPLPAPLHLLAGYGGFSLLTIREKIALGRMLLSLVRSPSTQQNRLRHMTIAEWFAELEQPLSLVEKFWDPLVASIMNAAPHQLSAVVFYRTLRTIFLGHRQNSSLMFFKTDHQRTFVEPATKYLEHKGSFILNGKGLTSMKERSGSVKALILDDGSEISGENYIIALPEHEIRRVAGAEQLVSTWSEARWDSSPIITVNLWFEEPISPLPIIGFVGAPVHWIFTRGEVQLPEGNTAHYVTAVLSAADTLIDATEQQLTNLVLREIVARLGIKNPRPLRVKVMKEKRATYILSPEVEACRPGPITSVSNLFLAGDWTATGFPATIEGAILSGRSAARAILHRLP